MRSVSNGMGSVSGCKAKESVVDGDSGSTRGSHAKVGTGDTVSALSKEKEVKSWVSYVS